MDNLIGKKLDGRYLLEELVGEGGMANVYRAMDLKEQRTVAVKILKEECTESEEMVRRFKNESKAISILNHPGIVKVYDVSVTDKIQYMVMEYVDGITLKEYLSLRGGPLTWKETLHFIIQVLEALSHAHSKGVVHRDVKPQNIMLQSNGQVKLMDFGIARFSQAENYALGDKAIGSVHYISPEQAKGMPTDATTDIYSVGVMMYEMLSGKLPFESNSAVSVAIKQISDEAVPLSKLMPDLPTGLSEICCKAMAKDHRDRYQSAPAMLEAIRQFKQDPSIQFEYKYLGDAAPTPVSRPAARPARQNKKAGSESTMAETGAHKGKAAPKSAPKAAPRKGRKRKNGSYFIPAMAGMAMAFLIGSIVLCYLIFTNSTNALFSNREDVDLVNFVGMSKSDVEGNSDYRKKFSITYVEEYNSNYEEGYIYSQTPKPPRTVKAGQKVTLKVSLGTLWVQVKDVTNMSQDQAVETLRERVKANKIKEPEEVKACLREILVEMLDVGSTELDLTDKPAVILMIGVNGVGKTTTIGKLANLLKNQGNRVLLAAGDTFRAAAADQLAIWADRAKVDLVRHEEGSDPAAVVFDAMNAARARKTDVVLVDTAGRLHNKQNLMNELNKIRRVIDREGTASSKEVLLVLDATTGQNGLIQAKQFGESAGITGIVLTKLDGTAKGGVVLAIAKEMGVPVKFVGLGEGIDDLQPFDAVAFAEALV